MTMPYGGMPHRTDGVTTVVWSPAGGWVCQTCGGAVADWQKHLRWHAELLTRLVQQANSQAFTAEMSSAPRVVRGE